MQECKSGTAACRESLNRISTGLTASSSISMFPTPQTPWQASLVSVSQVGMRASAELHSGTNQDPGLWGDSGNRGMQRGDSASARGESLFPGGSIDWANGRRGIDNTRDPSRALEWFQSALAPTGPDKAPTRDPADDGNPSLSARKRCPARPSTPMHLVIP